jgi:hypothetical protein
MSLVETMFRTENPGHRRTILSASNLSWQKTSMLSSGYSVADTKPKFQPQVISV